MYEAMVKLDITTKPKPIWYYVLLKNKQVICKLSFSSYYKARMRVLKFLTEGI